MAAASNAGTDWKDDELDAIVDAGAMFSIGFDITEPLRDAILAQPVGAWHRSIDQQDRSRPNGQNTADCSVTV